MNKNKVIIPGTIILVLLSLCTLTITAANSSSEEQFSISEVVDRVSPAVVSVMVYQKQGKQLIGSQNGSGFIIDEEGIILTNNHVVENGDRIYINLMDGTKVGNIKLLGADPISDIAVLKIPEKKLSYLLPTVKTGNSNEIRVGQKVIAFGNPFAFQLGNELTVTSGIISTKGRTIETNRTVYQEFIQTDAPINPGNSGGPLVNMQGEVIGITTARMASAEGIGFAIPINFGLKISNQLINQGKIIRPWLGITVNKVNPIIAERCGLSEVRGAYINYIAADSPASNSNLKKGDIILELNNTKIYNPKDVIKNINDMEPGEKVAIIINRKGTEKHIVLEVGKKQ